MCGGIESLPEKKLILSFLLCQLPAAPQVGLIKTYFKVLILKIHKSPKHYIHQVRGTKSSWQPPGLQETKGTIEKDRVGPGALCFYSPASLCALKHWDFI